MFFLLLHSTLLLFLVFLKIHILYHTTIRECVVCGYRVVSIIVLLLVYYYCIVSVVVMIITPLRAWVDIGPNKLVRQPLRR